MPKRRVLTEEEVVAKARAKFRARKPVGMPSRAADIMTVVHVAVQRMTGPLNQAKVMQATLPFYEKLHEKHQDWTIPCPRILRVCVKAYLCYRLGKSLAKFPSHIQRGVEALPSGLHADIVFGRLATIPAESSLVIDASVRARIDKAAPVTDRIRAIPSLLPQ